jgi:3-hydroxymyristoyl/3-hydroxydecanoyl-(acyl carrier protein) dehydratase
VYNERVIDRTEDSILLELIPLENWDYFDGHFPDFKLLPAVAQVEIVVRLAAKYFDCGIFVQKAKRIKFSSFIQPGYPVYVNLSYKKESETLNFSMKNPAGDIVYSSGTFILGTTDNA